MELISRTMGKVIGSAPQLDTVLMVEDFIEKNSGELNRIQIFRNLPKKMIWRTFKIILAYLEQTNKIVINKNGKITWIWNPEIVRKYLCRNDLEVNI